ncbi:vWA domain-containing protein [Tellurirhabdus rosea]|uniref:vWA domain-containing protein n=1 Tax=Tellurirhabdus rosea TaxID=2674997 RepID=UPI00225A4058|nr:von Willebrand factor type A domain-containing protein [Tellurirhabdus rosea]
MRQFFSMLCLIAVFLLPGQNVNAQPKARRTIMGTVTDHFSGQPIAGVTVALKNTNRGVATDEKGGFVLQNVPDSALTLVFSFLGYKTEEVPVGRNQSVLKVQLQPEVHNLQEVIVTGYNSVQKRQMTASVTVLAPSPNTEDYSAINENTFHDARQQPVTTFSADVDRASYANVRRFLNSGHFPPKDAVRIEELINYFAYSYPQPSGDDPVAIHTELAESPWNPGLQLLRIGLQARSIPADKLPPANLVFLVDVSGSMNQENKLPLVKAALKLLVGQLRPEDRVALVAYAGAAGLVLPPTPGSERTRIVQAIDALEAGGSTAGGAGLRLAYKIAAEHFRTDGNNRVILATDGDFNVGESSDAALQRLVEEQRETGVFLSVLGFGMGNYKDNKLETLADKGNGNYAYIDTWQEARKVFVQEFGGTLFAVAKDVKLQLEFNPAQVRAYRLIGYENRMLRNEDFRDDRKDAGEMGAGHSVTALYELIPAGTESAYLPVTDSLKYLRTDLSGRGSSEQATLKIRYKRPDERRSRQLEKVIRHRPGQLSQASADFRFAAAVAGFGLLLRNSEFKGKADYEQLAELARKSLDGRTEGDRWEFLQLVEGAKALTPSEMVKK